MECHANLSSDYKFYLGFDNSLCKDYLTEKVSYNFLDNNSMIYVARGAPNLHEFISKNTVIYTSNFRSPTHLAQFLIKNLVLTKQNTRLIYERQISIICLEIERIVLFVKCVNY
jgi:hypothetical protein